MTALSHSALAFALTTLITAPAISAQPSHSVPEIGHIGTSWWQATMPAMISRDTCNHTASATLAPETGPIAWNWWQHRHDHHNSMPSPSPFTGLSSETGHVPWDWWQHPDTHGGMPANNAC